MIRRLIPISILPLALIACCLSASPWLRAYPSAVLAVPMFGAAVLSVLAPLVVVGVGLRRLWATALIDLVLAVFYELLVTLRAPAGFDQLWYGLVHGPSQILTFALPLVSPRTLLVAPVALTWVAGAVIGECIARAWHSVVPYAVLLTGFGLSYAATTRAISSASAGRRYDTLLAALLLVALLLLRAAQAWVGQDRGAESAPIAPGAEDSRLPLRSVVIGTVTTLVLALAAAGAVQTTAFHGRPVTASRVPPLNRTDPFTPVSFVARLRPSSPTAKGRPLFAVTTNRSTSNFISLATVDIYDGSGWTFNRTFRPSGGVVPSESDPTLRPQSAPVTQQYAIDAGPLTRSPWMPYLDRATRVSGLAVNVDAGTGMVVPARHLTADSDYTVTSRTAAVPFSSLPATSLASLSGDATDIQLPGAVSSQLTQLISALSVETGVSSAAPIPFLQAVAADFRANYGLSGGTASAASASATSGTVSSPSRTPSRPGRPGRGSKAGSSTAASSGSASSSANQQSTGGTGFADVLASIRQDRSATPEQYATLMALLARKLGVRARLATGFRVPLARGATTLPEGRYIVTTADAWTWVEIPVTNVGWVALDASPGSYTPGPSSSASVGSSRSPSSTPSRSVQISKAATQTGGGAAVAPKSPTGGSADHSWWRLVWLILGSLAVLVLLVVLVLGLRKLVRARRRRRGTDPRHRLAGAWQETLDVLVEAGLPELDAYTSTEVAQATDERFGATPAEQVRLVGESANVAIFGPDELIGDAEADAAWQAHRELRRAVRRQLPVGARVGAVLRYHRAPRRPAAPAPRSWSDPPPAEPTKRTGGRHRQTRPRRAR